MQRKKFTEDDLRIVELPQREAMRAWNFFRLQFKGFKYWI